MHKLKDMNAGAVSFRRFLFTALAHGWERGGGGGPFKEREDQWRFMRSGEVSRAAAG
jgi:hypothetical protein